MTELSHIRLRKPHIHNRDGLVYYMERVDGAVKIGCTRSYQQRRSALVQRHGLPLKLVAWEPGYFDLEERRHQQFSHLRIAAIPEWFRVEEDLYEHILALRAAT